MANAVIKYCAGESEVIAMTIKALLVDDEPMALIHLQHVLRFFSVFSVTGACTTPEATLAACGEQPADIVFLDIEMPRIKGFELLEKLRALQPELMFVFVTAYRDYAIRAFETEAIDYLLKPVSKDRMQITAEKAERFFHLRQAVTASTPGSLIPSDMIPGKIDGRVHLLTLSDIIYFMTEKRWVVAVHPNGVYKLRYSLSYLENNLPEQLFIRCHHAFIVNLQKVEYMAPFFKNSYYIQMKGRHEKVPVSRTFTKKLRDRIQM